ncbi:MAG: hypothetical protein L0332_00605 [Chloroflexi bacterium]|nr:hypothetical protein [Chloroflexota bacterium]MCI0577586.1 hypothetical protein [Chloroflexota bacterium]MCI0644194.1 hypothetical protein [Chloroflexota bacterium]MCI0725223.1 hypothetical protein [Chloroflexota bacterium]
MNRQLLALTLLVLLLLSAPGATAHGPAITPAGAPALSASFTYQGRLTDGGSPTGGLYDFQFKLFDAASGGNQAGSPVTKDDVAVTDGLFTTQLDFGSAAFAGEARYLEISVRPGSSTGGYTTLLPRQELTAAPYALYSLGADKLDGRDADDFHPATYGLSSSAQFRATRWPAGLPCAMPWTASAVLRRPIPTCSKSSRASITWVATT